MNEDAAQKLLAIEEAREARRRRRNKVLGVLLIVAVLFGAFAIWGVSSQRAANERHEGVVEMTRILGG